MRKSRTKIISCLIILIIFICVGIVLFKNSFAVTDNENEKIIGEVQRLEEYAKDYITTNSISDVTSTSLALNYIRSLRYNDTKWNTLLGTVDTGFVQFVKDKGGVDINNNAYIVDETTYKKVDFIHMIAVLECYNKYGDNLKLHGITSISTDYSGWAGDLLTFLKEIYDYRVENGISDKNTLIKYANSLLGTNKNSSFSSEDIYGDLDALNLYKAEDIDLTNLSDALAKYYLEASSSYNYKNRVESTRSLLGSDEVQIKNKVTTLIQNNLVQKFLISDTAGKVTSLDYEVVSQAFVDYILEKPYLEISSKFGEATVGDDAIEVQLYESNLNVPKISMTKEICDVEVLDDIMYIRPTNSGKTTITLSSSNDKVSVKYELTSSNVAPSINKELEQEYSLLSGVESTITLSANGTNNTYTWYLGNTKDGEFTKLGVTVIPSYTFTPTIEMDGKYIKCVISNEGNESVSSLSLIKVKNVSIGDVVKTGDMTLKIALSIIFLVVCANVFVYTVRKYRYNLF